MKIGSLSNGEIETTFTSGQVDRGLPAVQFGLIGDGSVRVVNMCDGSVRNALGAHAYAQGAEIYFQNGGLGGSQDSFVAHELTHVVQQGNR